MTLKTVHLAAIAVDGAFDGDAALNYAAGLAAAHGAHLSITLGVPDLVFVFPEGGPAAKPVVEGINAGLADAARESAEALRTRLAARGIAATAEVVQAPADLVLSGLAGRARIADVVVAGRSGGSLAGRLAEDLLISTGRPLVLVPDGWRAPKVISRAVVAWDGSAKAARAVADALALLAKAEAVEVATVMEAGRAGPTDDLLAHLGRHLGNLSVARLVHEVGTVGEALARHVRDSQATLLVAGAYGHSRLREVVLGGTTAHLFEHPPCPVLLSY